MVKTGETFVYDYALCAVLKKEMQDENYITKPYLAYKLVNLKCAFDKHYALSVEIHHWIVDMLENYGQDTDCAPKGLAGTVPA